MEWCPSSNCLQHLLHCPSRILYFLFNKDSIRCLPASSPADGKVIPSQHTDSFRVITRRNIHNSPHLQAAPYTVLCALPNSHTVPNIDTTEQAVIRALFAPIYPLHSAHSFRIIVTTSAIPFQTSTSSLAVHVAG